MKTPEVGQEGAEEWGSESGAAEYCPGVPLGGAWPPGLRAAPWHRLWE